MEAVKDAAGKVARPGRGQGFQLDQDVKVAVEALAMNAAAEFYGLEWDVEDVHGTESYDLICRRGGEVKHVEVNAAQPHARSVALSLQKAHRVWRGRLVSQPAPDSRCQLTPGFLTDRVRHARLPHEGLASRWSRKFLTVSGVW